MMVYYHVACFLVEHEWIQSVKYVSFCWLLNYVKRKQNGMEDNISITYLTYKNIDCIHIEYKKYILGLKNRLLS